LFPLVGGLPEHTHQGELGRGVSLLRQLLRRAARPSTTGRLCSRGLSGPGRRLPLLMTALLALLLGLQAAGCSGPADDANEPNDRVEEATVLIAGAEVEGAFSPPRDSRNDTDIFRLDIDGEGPTAVVVTLSGGQTQETMLQMGIITPDGPERIMWPVWQREETTGTQVLRGTVGGPSTLIVVLQGTKGIYTLSALATVAE